MFSNQFEMAAAHRLLGEWNVNPLASKIIFQLLAAVPIPTEHAEVVVPLGPFCAFLVLPAPTLPHIRSALLEAGKVRTVMHGSRFEKASILEQSRLYGEGKFVGFVVNAAFTTAVRERGRQLALEESREFRPSVLH